MALPAPLKTFKFWSTLVLTNVSLLLVSGVILPGTLGTVVGWLTAVLTALGYKSLIPGQAPAELPSSTEGE